jgi:hypothetical protein
MTVFSGSDDKGAYIAAGSGTYTDQFWGRHPYGRGQDTMVDGNSLRPPQRPGGDRANRGDAAVRGSADPGSVAVRQPCVVPLQRRAVTAFQDPAATGKPPSLTTTSPSLGPW